MSIFPLSSCLDVITKFIFLGVYLAFVVLPRDSRNETVSMHKSYVRLGSACSRPPGHGLRFNHILLMSYCQLQGGATCGASCKCQSCKNFPGSEVSLEYCEFFVYFHCCT